MRKFISALIFAGVVLLMVGCTPTKPDLAVTDPTPDPHQIVKLNLPEVPPLDLSKYTTIKTKVMRAADGEAYVCHSLSDTVQESELLFKLQQQIELEGSYLKKYRDFYEPATPPQK